MYKSQVTQCNIFLFTACGLTIVRATNTQAIAYFLYDKLSMASTLNGLGFSLGMILMPTPSGNLFTHFGFNKTMFILAPVMVIHLFGAVLYTQHKEDTFNSTQTESKENKPLSATLICMATNPKVNLYTNHTHIYQLYTSLLLGDTHLLRHLRYEFFVPWENGRGCELIQPDLRHQTLKAS